MITWLPQKVPSLFTAMTTGHAATQNLTYGVNANAMVLNQHNAVYEIVVNNSDNGSHPIHIHGHAPQIVARSQSKNTHRGKPGLHKFHTLVPNPNNIQPPANSMGYTGDTSTMPAMPIKRDTWMSAPFGYTVIRCWANNPGVWFMHCHMDWHNIAGLAATVVEVPLLLQKQQSIPAAWTHSCASQGFPTAGNAAGNTQNYADSTGAVTEPAPLAPYVGDPPM